MNGCQTKRAIYFGLLIACLAGALLTVFLPFAYEEVLLFWTDASLVPMSIPAALMPDVMTGLLQEPSYNWMQLVYAAVLLFAGVTVTQLIRALLRVLRSLNAETPASAPLRLGSAPAVGLGFFALLTILGIWNQIYLNELTEINLITPPIWPLAGLLLHLAALRLARVLNAERARPAADQGCKNTDH